MNPRKSRNPRNSGNTRNPRNIQKPPTPDNARSPRGPRGSSPPVDLPQRKAGPASNGPRRQKTAGVDPHTPHTPKPASTPSLESPRTPAGPSPTGEAPRTSPRTPPRAFVPDAIAPAPVPPAPDSFIEEAASLGIEFEPGDLDTLRAYLGLLYGANELFNLTAVRDPVEAWRRHILDSLTLLPFLADLPESARVIDVGSGGGLPGVPLAICLPALRFTLLEATGKKAEFLKEVVRRLPLSNAAVVQERAERAGQDRGTLVAGPLGTRRGGHREMYQAAVARAVGPLAVIAELTAPFIALNGRVLLIKGEKSDAELEEAAEALRLLKIEYVRTMPTPTGRVVVLEKRAATPRLYPRPDGEPKRVPLGRSKDR